MSPTRSGSYRVPTADGGALAFIPKQSHGGPVPFNHDDAEPVARFGELRELLKAALPVVARQLLVDLPPSHRSADESQLLQDCARGRRDANAATLAVILDLQARGEARVRFLLSDAIRSIEARAETPTCVFSASEAEQQADADLDFAQLQFARERTPTRADQLIASAQRHLHTLRHLLVSAHLWKAKAV